MADWLQLMPEGGPDRVEKAREVAQRIHDQIPEDMRAVDAARVERTKADQAERERLAGGMREGRDLPPDTRAIDQARDRVSAAERRLEARRLALAGAQQELGDVARDRRMDWLKSSEQAAVKARSRARKALETLEQALRDLGQARSTEAWLTPVTGGLDREQMARGAVLGRAPSSAFSMANAAPVEAGVLLGWVAELIDPPSSRGTMPQPEGGPQPLQPVPAFGAYPGPR